MRNSRALLPALLAMLALSIDAACESLDQGSPEPDWDDRGFLGDSVGEMVLDRTLTRMGHEFYRHFSQIRFDHGSNGGTHLAVQEQPSARWGSIVTVTGGGRELFRVVLQPSVADLRPVAEAASARVDDRLNQWKVEQLLSDNFDLEKDEL